ncbi:CRISPR-associated endonuclease Cas1 [Desulfonema limicola]|uniref:CRISPR-associated endonuclease Cas1 n=1 Tax=Desulfonema limicola TaxID=45656 RepID=A0A975BAG9_9BACT|nr:CRISPR-associated endonuclease Cas1 [Desulfonema limicola]QTA81768.1 CRISPR-associated endonuclease Cas1 [Desulfonema limicola]
MSKLSVILDRKELVVRMESDILRIDQPACNPEKIPLNLVREVIVIGRPMVSSDVWRSLASRNIPAVLLSSRGSGEAAYMGAGLSVNIVNRVKQYECCQNKEIAMKIGKWLINKKLEGQEKILKELDKSGREAVPYSEQIKNIRDNLGKAENNHELMGYEGSAAAAYFKGISSFLEEKWHFSGRNRRPPVDPVNSLLSLSYVIAAGEILRVVQVRGLDPCIGFFHALQSGRQSLILDILEPIRPEIDRFVFSLLDNPLTPSDFRTSERDGCRLTKNARRIYYNAWAVWKSGEREEAAQTSLEQMIIETVREIIRFINPDSPEIITPDE